MKVVELISDYTSLDEPNTLKLIRDSQGDIHLNMIIQSDTERGVRIANSGTRYSSNVREALYNLIKAIENDNS